ncbi:LysR family transcriptional regulator [Azohydromonas australica]|uniref:LysR family transcriptional regulator n=1 Tax=Azohydromonas australica TaxID=364039 RepID=UPI000411A8F6|nr:LysR family transcriptional regulator [Azohydromonas australica]
MHLTLRQLRYFVEIARSRSFSRAAEHLSVAQPALSQNIAALEAELGAKLFERHARGVELSEAGHRLYARAVELLAGFDSLRDHVEGRPVRPSGPVRVSIAGSLAAVVIAPLLRRVTDLYPDVELTVTEALSFEVRRQVESGEVHLALMPGASELLGMEALPVFEERFMLFGTYGAMRREPKQLPFAEVVQRPLAAPDRGHDLRKIIERAASSLNQPLDVRYELNSPPMLVAIVKEGLAYAVLPVSACIEAVAAKSVAGRLIVEPELTRVQALVWPKDRPLTPAAAAVRDAIAHVMAELVRDERLHGRLLDTTYINF